MTYNRLANETSPYLLQHKDNPVHWRPWGLDAFDEARRQGKPVLLSVGYAACHWCHVMAHESFENPEIAGVMNELFVNIKVDREERPDVDALYMTALHSLGEQGGWPLTMFLNADAEPFWGGTYFPPAARFGRPGFAHVLREIARIYAEEPEKVCANAKGLREQLSRPQGDGAKAMFSPAIIAGMGSRLVSAYDPVHGGLNGAPKFPNCSILCFTWKAGLRFGHAPSLDAVKNTLTHICQGGIYDHLGGGFARYSVDERWLAPHFEKMLYDNAQLVELLTEAWKETGAPLYAARVAETVEWLLREMRVEGGAFASSYDADSEGVEGKFYTWSEAEILDILGPVDGAFFAGVYDVSADGNWEETNILNRLASLDLLDAAAEARLAAMRAKLFEHRRQRIPPGWDDKVLADWNGLTICALARAAEAFERPAWLAAARAAYAFIRREMTRDGRLMHSWRAGQAKTPGIAPDYANMIAAALQLHQTTGAPEFLADAETWAATLHRHYWNADGGGYYLSADDTRDVIIRTLAASDDAMPNANAVMLGNLAALGTLTAKDEYRERGRALFGAFSAAAMARFVNHCGLLDGALDLMEPRHLVITGAEDEAGAAAMRAVLRQVSLPGAVVQVLAGGAGVAGGPLAGKTAIGGKATAYWCSGMQCSPPVTDAEALRVVLAGRAV